MSTTEVTKSVPASEQEPEDRVQVSPVPDETTENVLNLSTAIKPCKTFTVDGHQYEILTFAHLSGEQEAKVTAMIARHDRLNLSLETTGSDREADSVSRALRAKRVAILCALTTMPKNVATKLPMPAQAALMNAVQRELADETEAADPES
jgi:hypothetical protein